MNRLKAKLFLAVVGAGCIGCGAQMAVIGREKHAYVVRQRTLGFNSDIWHCDASSGKPVCTQVEEN